MSDTKDFFGMTLERVAEIKEQIRLLGEELQPLHERAKAEVCEDCADVTTVEEARLIAQGGLLIRLDQGLGEAHFWLQGVQHFLEMDEPGMEDCNRIAMTTIQAYGGVRDMQDPYAKTNRDMEEALQDVLAGLGLDGTGVGMMTVTTVREKPEAPVEEPVA